jgi:hypothetical protein
VALESNIAAVVAALDLKLVRLLRDAINQTDPSKFGISPAPRIEPRKVHRPDPRIEPRKVIHPTPRFEPRPVIRPTPRAEPTPPQYVPPCESETPCRANNPIEPPWKTLPWAQALPVTPPAPPARVKVMRVRPDIACRGRMIDVMS